MKYLLYIMKNRYSQFDRSSFNFFHLIDSVNTLIGEIIYYFKIRLYSISKNYNAIPRENIRFKSFMICLQTVCIDIYLMQIILKQA